MSGFCLEKSKECGLFGTAGCGFAASGCKPVVAQCVGCQHADPSGYCGSCPDPAVKWRRGACNMATHLAPPPEDDTKKKTNPLKASKRGNNK